MLEEKLIDAVKEHKELYDSNHANYSKVKLKNRIWSKISKDLNLNEEEQAKDIWTKLRGCYRDSQRRRRKWLTNGISPRNLKEWRFSKQMSFLEPYMSHGKEENIDSDGDSSAIVTAEVVKNCLSDNEERFEQAESQIVKDEALSNEMVSSLLETPQSKSKKKDDIFRSLGRCSKEEREERVRELSVERKEFQQFADDPLYNFFLSMYQLTKAMPLRCQHKVRNRVYQAVSDTEEELMNIAH